jgi:hypothetical protein
MGIKTLRVALLLAGFMQAAFGVTITQGFFNIAGTVYVTNATGSPVVTPAGTCPAGVACILFQDSTGTTNGKIDISSSGLPNGNIPASIAGNDAATISNLMNPPDIVGSFPPVVFLSGFMGGVTTTLSINNIFPGIYSPAACGAAPAVGQQCTPPGSLFNLVNNPPPPGQATVTWAFSGTTNSGSTWVGNFTSQFPGGTPYQTVLGELATNNFVSNTFSGTITLSAVPEPGTLVFMMVGCGLIGLALLYRRRSVRAR